MMQNMKFFSAVLLHFVLMLEGSGGITRLSHPWMIVNRSALILKVECNPPPEDWVEIYDLRIYAYWPRRNTLENTTLAFITSSMPSPVAENVSEIGNVTFTGNWDKKTSSLSLMMSISEQEFGIYYCTVQHKNRLNQVANYSVGFPVNRTNTGPRPPPQVDKFKVEVIEAHEITVTWFSPQESEFTEASVLRVPTDIHDKMSAAPQSLFSCSVQQDLVYDKAVTLLAKFNHDSRSQANFTMHLFVTSSSCYPNCRYSCHVPYHDCLGQNVHFCFCSQDDIAVYTESNSQPENTNLDWRIAFIVTISLFIAVVVAEIVVFCLFYYKRFKAARKTRKPTADENQPNQHNQDSSEQSLLNSGSRDLPEQPSKLQVCMHELNDKVKEQQPSNFSSSKNSTAKAKEPKHVSCCASALGQLVKDDGKVSCFTISKQPISDAGYHQPSPVQQSENETDQPVNPGTTGMTPDCETELLIQEQGISIVTGDKDE